MNPVRGSCLCEGIRFELRMPSKWVAHCHCSLCRRAHGAPFVTWVGVKADQFRITAGTELIGTYHSTPGASRRFCKTCGSPLFFESQNWPDEVHIAVAHLKDPLDKAPQAHVHYDSKADWIVVKDGLPLHGAPGTGPLLPNNTQKSDN
ncbi:GFA family protein [Oligoflexus tunisiensis]|uniref:GFA family protein n=1 Tax=Oligoflexus tunisiensis TaxID=708132 RepID=UPI001C405CCC|nr:GFA family protein [Oligoflexus tunisiensis]